MRFNNKDIDHKVGGDFLTKKSNIAINSKAKLDNNPHFQSAKNLSKKSIRSPIKIAKNADNNLENKNVVCLPNLRNDSPKSDSKSKSTP